MGLIDFAYIAESYPSGNNWGSLAEIISAIGAVFAVVLAYMAYLQSDRTKKDSVAPYANIRFSVTKDGFYLDLTNNGLGPMILTGDPTFTLNGNQFNATREAFEASFYNDLHIFLMRSVKVSLHEGDSLKAGETKRLIHHLFYQPLEFGAITQLQQLLAVSKFTLTINYRSMHNDIRQTHGTYHLN